MDQFIVFRLLTYMRKIFTDNVDEKHNNGVLYTFKIDL